MKPLVSVVIPSYNHERYLEEAMESALSSFDDLELIAVDDGSTDRSREILQSQANDSRVQVLLQENQGAHHALNRALRETRGEFVFILNSDDRFSRQRIPTFIDRFEKRPETLTLCSWIRIIDGEGKELGIKHGDRDLAPWPPRQSKGLLSHLGNPALSLLETNFISTSSNLAFRRRLLLEHSFDFPNLRYTHDWFFALAAATAGPLEVVEQPLVDYRVHEKNTIKEGGGSEDSGQGERRMHFEILWTLASHSELLRRASTGSDRDAARKLAKRQWSSLPPFISTEKFGKFLHIRGTGQNIPASYWVY